jgi:Kazal-type serine protease inhibitor domain
MTMRLAQQAAAAIIIALGLALSTSAGAVGLGKMCGGIAGIRCDKGLFCNHKAGACRVADAAGVCVRRTKICSEIFKPVCGCNGKTYGNDCQRIAAGVQLAHGGACKPIKKPTKKM